MRGLDVIYYAKILQDRNRDRNAKDLNRQGPLVLIPYRPKDRKNLPFWPMQITQRKSKILSCA